MGVLKGVLGWILGDDPSRVELEALPDEPTSGSGEVPIFLSANDLRSVVPAEYLRADAPFTSEDVRIKSSEFIDFDPNRPLRIPALKLALWCPNFVSIPGGMTGGEIIEFPQSVLVRSVALHDPAGGDVDIDLVRDVEGPNGTFVPLNKGSAGTGDALSDEHGNPFAECEEEKVVLSEQEIEETRKALRETALITRPDPDGGSFREVLNRESAARVVDKPSPQSGSQGSVGGDSGEGTAVIVGSASGNGLESTKKKSRPQMPNVHRIMRAYLQDGAALAAKGNSEVEVREGTPEGIARGRFSETPPAAEVSVEQLVQAEQEIRYRSGELFRPSPEGGSPAFKRLERALSGYPTVTGVSVRTHEGDFFSGDTTGYVSAGEAGEEIRRAFAVMGSMSIRSEAVTCLTVFNETDAVTVLCSRNAQISIIHGAEGLPLSARRAASRWLADL